MPSYRTVIANPGTHKRRNAKKTTKKKTVRVDAAAAEALAEALGPPPRTTSAGSSARTRVRGPRSAEAERVKSARMRKRGDRGGPKSLAIIPSKDKIRKLVRLAMSAGSAQEAKTALAVAKRMANQADLDLAKIQREEMKKLGPSPVTALARIGSKKVAKRKTKKKATRATKSKSSGGATASGVSKKTAKKTARKTSKKTAKKTAKRTTKKTAKKTTKRSSSGSVAKKIDIRTASDAALRCIVRSKTATLSERLAASMELEKRCRDELRSEKPVKRSKRKVAKRKTAKKTAKRKTAKRATSGKRRLSKSQLIQHIKNLEQLSGSLLNYLRDNFDIEPKVLAEVMESLRQSVISNSACKQAAIRWGNTAASCNKNHFIPKFIPKGPKKKGKFTGPQVMGEWSTDTKWKRASSLHNKNFWGD